MDKNEEYVRSVWETAHVSDWYAGRECAAQAWSIYLPGGWSTNRTGNTPHDKEMWDAAAEFTREHKEKVRQLRRQVSLMKEGLTDWAVEILLSDVGGEMSADLLNAEYVRDECTGYFVLALLEAELTRLTAGMKPEAV